MNRQTQIERRLDQILSLWLKVAKSEREGLLLERIRLRDELDKIQEEALRSA